MAGRTNPKISIITPNYNYGRFLEDTILSVKDQTYAPFEHIVMDGGSTDGTVDILRRYEGTYDLRWSSEPDRGQCHALNKGIGEATGEWLYFLNSDDYLLDDHSISRVVDYIEHHPGYSIYMGKIWGVDIKERIVEKNEAPFAHPVYTHDILLNREVMVVHQGTFYHRRVFEKAGLYSEDFHTHMDYEYHLRASKHFDIAAMDIAVACLRNHPDAKSKQRTSRRYLELYRARRMNGGKLWHRHNLYFLKGYLATSKWSRRIYQFLLRRQAMQWISERTGWKYLGFS